MNIAIVGSGYVGLVSAACFAEMGARVYCVDIDKEKIEKLNQAIIPIYEPNLEDMVKRNLVDARLSFTTDLASCINEVEVIFCAVGTPADEDGSADISYVLNVARTVGANMQKYILLVTKSTVPVGTAALVRKEVQKALEHRGLDIDFDVASNPEFLKEGSAIQDFMSPDRVVVGVDNQRSKDIMTRLYRPLLLKNFRILFTDIASAEMIKYAANAMLATRVSFMNDIANLCERVGADVNLVREGIGADTRIGYKFLYPGCGYGGSCFPKDVKALIKTAEDLGYEMSVLKSVEEVNNRQKRLLFDKLAHCFNNELEGKNIAIWGLAFKPNTDDMREAPSLTIIDLLLKSGANIRVYDPISMDECRRRLGAALYYSTDIYDAAKGADAILLLTEWKQFRMPNWDIVSSNMRHRLLIDGRNIYMSKELESYGFEYKSIGRD